jgi:hypothetical protein
MKRWLLALLVVGLLFAAAFVAAVAEGGVGDVAGGLLCSAVVLLLLIVTVYVLVTIGSAFRRPTEAQLRAQKLDNPQTWHFRPVGLLTYLGAMGGALALGLWLQDRFPEKRGVARLLTYGVALLLAASMSLRRMRDFLFYTGEESTKEERGP